MESDSETRVSIPVVFVNRHGLYVIVVVLGVAILGSACVLGLSFRNFTMLKQSAEEVHGYIASRMNSSDAHGGSHPRTNHLSRSYAGTDAIKAQFTDVRRG
ncbi:hypothetical protein MRX96_016984 [Rhipicephalus microplus]